MLRILEKPVQYLKGMGPKRAKVFAQAGINTLEDLLYFFPRRYEDRTKFTCVSKLTPGSTQTIQASVFSVKGRRSIRRSSFNITEAVVGDSSGKITCVWFNQPYLERYFKPGEKVILYGKVQEYSGRLQMNSPEFEFISDEGDDSLGIGRIVPVYRLPESTTQRYMRRIIDVSLNECLPSLADSLPFDMRERNGLFNLARSLRNIHFPESQETREEANKRLSFEEFLLFEIPLVLRKRNKRARRGIAHKTDGELVREFVHRLPFKLTSAQLKCLDEIKEDMQRPYAMQRLLQGDVGSGKTIVATIAALTAIGGGYQTAFMVPTEILARQHYENLRQQAAGLKAKEVRICLLISSLDKKEKEKSIAQIKEGKADLVIGTHALLEEKVGFKKLGLAIIDEQHKFGVGQRALLPGKGDNPDVLIMTATPIPRTLAITLYGDMDISVINELPAGRRGIKTLSFRKEDSSKAYSLVRNELKSGRQAYMAYPVIEDSFALDIAGAKKRYEELKAGEFKDFRLGLVHARLKQREQESVMERFRTGELDMLVATTVLEVGIDIPNATCMVIEEAERFGLAQLHQLRGRVGRGGFGSFCLLISDADTLEAKQRIEAIVRHADGFRIAEEDLKLRGPGEFFGERQHGLAELKLADPLRQMQLLKHAREEAIRLLSVDPRLDGKQHQELKLELLRRFPEYDRLMLVG